MATEAEVSDADREAILSAARDYIESWLDGDADQMGGCLHPDLVKREIEGRVVDSMSRDDMVAATAKGYGRKHDRPYEMDILDAYGDMATVRILSAKFMDHVQVARGEDRWRLVNVLWQRRPGA